MDDRHVIKKAVFDIHFDSEEQAWAEQEGLDTYVKSGLLPVIDKIFSEFSQPELNLSFDLLEIDLGTVSYDSHRDELSNRLREQLRESLARLIPAESADGGPRLETAWQRDLSLLRFFLERGHLPWHAGTAEAGRMEETLLWLLRGRDSGFLRFLAGAANGERLLARVVSQFSEAVLNELTAALRSFSHDVPMPVSDNTPQMEQEWPLTLMKEPVAEGAAAELFPAELSLRIGHALEEGDASWLSSAWPELRLEYPRSLLAKLRRHGRSASVRRRIAERFPESAIKEILLFLEPGEVPFIDEITGKSELFRRADLSGSDDGNSTRRRLWEFTLGYLLEERGSLFNRRAYMSSLVTSTVAYAGLDLMDLLADMKQVLESFPATAPLRQELFGILDGLEGEAAPQRPSGKDEPCNSAETTEIREPAFLIEEALLSGSLRELVAHWSHLLRKHPLLLQKELRRLGRRETFRSKMAELFSADMLREILTLLEPGESEFIEVVMEWPQLFCGALPYVQEDVAKTRKWLWEFTLGCLLEEQGTAFNRKAYLGSMMRHIAARGNYDLQELLLSVHEQLSCLVLETRLQAEFWVLVEEIASESGVTLLRAAAGSKQRGLDFAESLVRELSEAFLRGTPRDMADVWLRMLQSSPQLLLLELRRHGADAALRKRIAGNFSEMMLRQTVALLEPGEIFFIEELAARPELFRQASPHLREGADELKKRLWECTLEYLLEDRGSRFNRKSYLDSLVRRMAARDGVDARELLLAMHGMLIALEATTPFAAEILELVEGLCAESGLPLSPTVENPLKPDEGTLPGEISLRIGKALLHGTSEDQALIRTEFLHSHSLLLREELRKLGQWESVRRRIAERFSEELLRELVLLLEPPGMRLIELFPGLQDLFGRVGVGATSLTGEGSNKRLWEFTFGYLLEDRGSSFNNKSYLSSLIRQMVVRDDQSFPALLNALRGALADAGASDTFHGELLALVDELLAEASDEAVPDEPGKPGSDAHPANSLAKRLRQLLIPESGASQARAGELKETLDDFAAHQPEQLAQVFRELSSEGTFSFARKGFYAPEEFRRMIELFLLLVNAVEPEKLANFLGALDQWSARSGNAPRFLEQVFELLLQNRPVDFEALAAGSELSGSVQATDGSVSMPQRHLPEAEATGSSTVWRLDDAPGGFSDQIYIDNAGLVLAAPYLPQLFGVLRLLEGQAFIDEAAVGRGVHLLQYMAEKVTETAEPLLVLNKILCGMTPETPVALRIGIEAREMEIVEGLIKGMIGNWNVLGATTTDSFRESFLQREGVLRMKEDGWHLMVESKAYDLLLDQIPWSFSVIRHPWMPQALHVEWRHGL